MSRVPIDSRTFLAIPWHDAPILTIRIGLADDGRACVTVRCALHPDEPRDLLIALGIHTAVLEICFHDVLEVCLNVHANTSNREWIGSWDVVPSSEGGYLRYHIVGTGGSTLDLEAWEVWLYEINE